MTFQKFLFRVAIMSSLVVSAAVRAGGCYDACQDTYGNNFSYCHGQCGN